LAIADFLKDCFSETPKPTPETGVLPGILKTKHNGRFRITSFLQLESRTCLFRTEREAHRPALILLFAKKFFRGPSRTGTYQRFGFAAQTRTQISLAGSSVTLANEVERSNILAPGFWFRIRGTPLLPAFTIAF